MCKKEKNLTRSTIYVIFTNKLFTTLQLRTIFSGVSVAELGNTSWQLEPSVIAAYNQPPPPIMYIRKATDRVGQDRAAEQTRSRWVESTTTCPLGSEIYYIITRRLKYTQKNWCIVREEIWCMSHHCQRREKILPPNLHLVSKVAELAEWRQHFFSLFSRIVRLGRKKNIFPCKTC